jgi:hypothetical protein
VWYTLCKREGWASETDTFDQKRWSIEYKQRLLRWRPFHYLLNEQQKRFLSFPLFDVVEGVSLGPHGKVFATRTIFAPLARVADIITNPHAWSSWDIYCEEAIVLEHLHNREVLLYIRYPTSFLCIVHRAMNIANNAHAVVFYSVRDPQLLPDSSHNRAARFEIGSGMGCGGILAYSVGPNVVRIVYLVEVGTTPPNLPPSQYESFLRGIGRARLR